VKVATNTVLKNRMPDVIDFDSGPIIDGEQTIAQNADALLEYVIRLASGEEITKPNGGDRMILFLETGGFTLISERAKQ
jgi:altronate dehydratase